MRVIRENDKPCPLRCVTTKGGGMICRVPEIKVSTINDKQNLEQKERVEAEGPERSRRGVYIDGRDDER